MEQLLKDTGTLAETPGYVPNIYSARFDIWKLKTLTRSDVQLDIEAHSFAHAVYRLLTEVSKSFSGHVELRELRVVEQRSGGAD